MLELVIQLRHVGLDQHERYLKPCLNFISSGEDKIKRTKIVIEMLAIKFEDENQLIECFEFISAGDELIHFKMVTELLKQGI